LQFSDKKVRRIDFDLMIYRCGISDYQASALANGLLKDFGIITATDRVEVLDPSKISRERQRISSASLVEPDLTNLRCLGLDSKRDSNALVIQEVQTDDGETRAYKTAATVDNLTFTVESGKPEPKFPCKVGSEYPYRTVPYGYFFKKRGKNLFS
jgi:hypothetical protein